MKENILREAIEEALTDVHIETGRADDHITVVNMLEICISKKIRSHDIDSYTEEGKDFSDYNLFDK